VTETDVTETTDQARTSAAVRVDEWLHRFETALRERDIEGAAALFAVDSY
jgi:putative flavoprotein involved in K+ transport